MDQLDELWNRSSDPKIEKAQQDVMDLFDLNAEIEIFELESMELYTSLLSERGSEVFDQLGIGLTFDVSDRNVQQALQELTFKFADHVNRTTKEQLRQELSEAISEGEGIPLIRKRVQKVFDGTIRATAPRARMIARTETISIANGGNILAYDQSGIVQQKEWLSSRDNRVRPTHVQADGQVRDFKQPFSVGGHLFDYPGDPKAPPQERINCRCTLLPVLTERTDDNPYGRYKEYENTIFGDIDDPEQFVGFLDDHVDHLLQTLKGEAEGIIFVKDKDTIVDQLRSKNKSGWADHIEQALKTYPDLKDAYGFYSQDLGATVWGQMRKIPKMNMIDDIPDDQWTFTTTTERDYFFRGRRAVTTIHELGHFMDSAIRNQKGRKTKEINDRINSEISSKYGYSSLSELASNEDFKIVGQAYKEFNTRSKQEVGNLPEVKWLKGIHRNRRKHVSRYQDVEGEGPSEALSGYIVANDWMKKNHKKDWDLMRQAEKILGVKFTPLPKKE